jgi:DNA-binding transcriptional regulator YhcF (GntR family)
MSPIDDAIAELKSHEAGERPSYKDCAAKFGVDRNTLSRRVISLVGGIPLPVRSFM